MKMTIFWGQGSYCFCYIHTGGLFGLFGSLGNGFGNSIVVFVFFVSLALSGFVFVDIVKVHVNVYNYVCTYSHNSSTKNYSHIAVIEMW